MKDQKISKVTEKIGRSEMRTAIKNSGYLMEQRIFPIMEEEGYYVETNPVYPDPFTDKAREYDFSAITAKKLFREDFDFLYTHLIGECVNNSQPIVFFTSETPIDFLFHEDIKCAGIPLYFPENSEDNSEVSFQDYFHLEKFHHYCHGIYSTQYCSFKLKSKKPEWMAWHDEEHHSVFNSLIEATRYTVKEFFSEWVPPEEDEEEPVNLNLFYPVLIIRDDLYECKQTKRQFSLRKKNHLQFRKSAISSKGRETYQVDVIVESYLPKFLSILDEEALSLKRRLARKKKLVREAVDRIVEKANKEKSQNKSKTYKDVLEF
ncbi:MAG: hypothetical protein J7L08_01230 [Candidatus Aenigmarchaeota archaeon]|nr:hypothetical protein [Candidatus Aenigmarchaeota archaeon]